MPTLSDYATRKKRDEARATKRKHDTEKVGRKCGNHIARWIARSKVCAHGHGPSCAQCAAWVPPNNKRVCNHGKGPDCAACKTRQKDGEADRKEERAPEEIVYLV